MPLWKPQDQKARFSEGAVCVAEPQTVTERDFWLGVMWCDSIHKSQTPQL